MNNIPKILRKLRGKKTIAETAKEIGITPSALSNYETGIRVPRDQIKIKIAKHYGKTVESIFFKD